MKGNMELRDYVKIVRKHFIVFIIVVILGGGFAFFFTKRQPVSYTAQTTFTVNKTSALKQSQVNYYLYDNYYNIQSAGLFSQVVTTWFSSPAVVAEIYQKAGVDSAGLSQKALSKSFKAVFSEPATINVTLSGANKDELSKLMNAAGDVLQKKTNELNNGDTVYEIAKFKPIISQNKPNTVINSLIGLIAGAILGIILALSISYFREEK